MLFAPFLSLMVSFWAFGNRQLFENVVGRIETFNQVTPSHHLVTDPETLPQHTHVQWLFYGIIVFGGATFIYCVVEFVTNYHWRFKVRKILPNYFQALRVSECEELVEEEEFFRSKGGFSTLSNEALIKLRTKCQDSIRKKGERDSVRPTMIADQISRSPLGLKGARNPGQI